MLAVREDEVGRILFRISIGWILKGRLQSTCLYFYDIQRGNQEGELR